MNFLFKFVKSRKTISNISDLTSKHPINELHPIKTNELTEKLGSSNISKNQIRSNKKDDIINKLPKSMSATVNASAIVASTSSSIPSTFHSPSYSVLKSCSHNSDNYSQRNMEEPDKHSKLCRLFPINPEPANITNVVQSSELYKPFHINTQNELI
ncbi:uncharacterized protein LOC116849439 isoform X2 [Odontomachus brunneus]|uniref:uncharacterized protein LOC116849439 isoform X2 n=1 Tax=Odontomachus brunneus TaxID=486640 RepID=UPI0013F1A09F|nr:uncharacterized protein LOC116849439 isoform X2 [Odontomachus brunneus]